MDTLRQALGNRQLTYLGISYGTYLGATYANMFPGRVRAMVLDANIGPVAWAIGNGTANSLSVSLRLHADEGSARTLNAFLGLCGRAGPARCAFAAASTRTTRAKFSRLLQRLRTHPVTAGGATYTFAKFFLGARTPESFRQFGILPAFTGVVVSDRYQNVRRA